MTPELCPVCNNILSASANKLGEIFEYYCSKTFDFDYSGWNHYMLYPFSNKEIFRITLNDTLFEIENNFNYDSCDIQSMIPFSFYTWQPIHTFNYTLSFPQIKNIVNRLPNLKAFI